MILLCIGCAKYSLTAHNRTGEEISNARITFKNKNGFGWGTMANDVTARGLFLDGPYKSPGIIEWLGGESKKYFRFEIEIPKGLKNNEYDFYLYHDKVEIKTNYSEHMFMSP